MIWAPGSGKRKMRETRKRWTRNSLSLLFSWPCPVTLFLSPSTWPKKNKRSERRRVPCATALGVYAFLFLHTRPIILQRVCEKRETKLWEWRSRVFLVMDQPLCGKTRLARHSFFFISFSYCWPYKYMMNGQQEKE
jgi:hypothetical protein